MADARLAQTLINQDSARVGVFSFEVAPFAIHAKAERIADPSTIFQPLGIIDPMSFKGEFSRELLDLFLGMPKTKAKSFVIGQSGNVEFSWLEYNAGTIELVAGGHPVIRTTSGATTIIASPVPTVSVFTVTTLPVGTATGKYISVTYASGAMSGQTVDRKVLSVATAAITLLDPLPIAPTTGDAVALLTDWDQAVGGIEIVEKCGRIIYTDSEGDKAIAYLPKFISVGPYVFGGGENEVMKVPVKLDCRGVQEAVGSKTDYILARQYLIPA